MLKVSTSAKEKLAEALQKRPGDSEETFRIVLSTSEPKQFQIGLDKAREGDQVVENDEGTKILLVETALAAELQGWEIDYKETPQGAGFTVSPMADA